MKLATTAATCSLLIALFAGAALAATVSVGVTVEGGSGNDTLVGTANSDSIDGNAGNDQISGKAENDVLVGGSGKDNVSGGLGDDSIYVQGDTQRDVVVCSSGDDTAYVSSNDVVDNKRVSSIVEANSNTTSCETIVVQGGGSISSEATS